MEREDRRIVFAKLQEVYLDENEGYSGDWTDERIALDLGVPRAWVEAIREENFGPVKTNEEIERLRAAVLALKDKIDRYEKELANAAATATAAIQKKMEFHTGKIGALRSELDSMAKTIAKAAK